MFIASVVLALLFYSGAVSVRDRHPFLSLAEESGIVRIEGEISSNPVRTRFSDSSYMVGLRAARAFTKSGSFSAGGEVTLFVPDWLVESYYPGKTYSAAAGNGTGGFLVESGAVVSFDVRPAGKSRMRSAFIVTGGRQLGWAGNFFTERFFRFRALCRLQFKRLMYAWGSAGGLLLALLSGSREYTDRQVSDGFRDAGLAHILALSGMHLGLFGSVARFLGRKARGRAFGEAAQLLAVVFFVWFAGLSPSLFRAFLAALILYLNSLLRMRRPDGISLVSVCFIIHVLVFPSHIHETAFMLSYASLSGIVVLAEFFRRFSPVFLPHRIRLSLSDSLAAQIASAPVALHLFGRVAPQGVVASLLVSPLVLLFLYIGLFGVIICVSLPFLSAPINAIMSGLYFLIKGLVSFFSMG